MYNIAIKTFSTFRDRDTTATTAQTWRRAVSPIVRRVNDPQTVGVPPLLDARYDIQ